MKAEIFQKSPLFDYFPPLTSSMKGLLSIPHSGEVIPPEFEQYLSGNLEAYKEDADYRVHELIDIEKLRENGIGVIKANIHRICVDLNRAPKDSVLFWVHNTKGVKIVTSKPSAEIEASIIANYHAPYFEVIKAIMRDLEKKKAGSVSFVDLHSMPSKPTEYHMKQNPNQKTHRSDFCISDQKGKTCSKEFIDFFCDDLTNKGYEVWQNDPYVGGFVTIHIDQEYRTNNIQIEINRRIYMDESSKTLIPEFVQTLRPHLTETLIRGFNKFDS